MAQNHCTHCGSLLPEGSTFCPNCGQSVVSQPQQPQPQYQQQPQYQSQQPQQAQYQSPYQQPSRPSSGGGNNGLLYGIIGLLALLLIGGGVYYFVSSNNEKEAAQVAAQAAAQAQQKEQADQLNELKEKQEKLEAENKKLTEENAKKSEKVIVKEGAANGAEHRAVSAGGSKAKVVINGDGVRLRFAPSLNSGYLTWSNGQTRAPKKGSRLDYIGQDEDWYQVSYLGHTFYVSKEYSYLEY